MRNILLLGAGLSAATLIQYLTKQAAQCGWLLTIADLSVDHLKEAALPAFIKLKVLNIQQEDEVKTELEKVDLVISMLPAGFHPAVARLCLSLKKHLVTASYVSPEIREMDAAAKKAGLLFMMEAGLDPGIDHMSAMAIIQKIKNKGGEIAAFKSYTGGLIAPESDNNPWHYKFTWNPRNVVLAGQGTAKYLENNTCKYIPYHQLFNRTELLTIPALGEFDGYVNRNSLLYREPYGLQNIPTIIRGTLRRRGFCQGWHQLVQLGLTDATYTIRNSAGLTYRQFLESYLPASKPDKNWLIRLAEYLHINPGSKEMALLEWLGFEEELIDLENATPAQILEKLLTQKWQLAPYDKDMVVMQHIFEYKLGDEKRRLTSSLVVIGEDAQQTAMAKTVGLPVGIITKLILQKQLNYAGVLIPTLADIYEPVLEELANYGITFIEEDRALLPQA